MTILPPEDMKHFLTYKQCEIQRLMEVLLADTVRRGDLPLIIAQLEGFDTQKLGRIE
jgi:hypothetical protein